MKRSKLTLFSITALMTAMLACSAVSNLLSTPTPLPTSTPRATSTPAATATAQGVLFEESTFDASSCLPTFTTDEINRRAENGAYFIDILVPGYIGWTYCEDKVFTDFVMEADIAQVSGPNDSEYGVVFRYDDTLKEFYAFNISSDGYYSFTIDGTNFTEATYLIKWAKTDTVKQGLASNHVKVVATGGKFQFYVNDQLVAEAEDSTHAAGWVGFVAFTPKDGPAASFSFDNLVIRSVSDSSIDNSHLAKK